jgi:hypothetical protein
MTFQIQFGENPWKNALFPELLQGQSAGTPIHYYIYILYLKVKTIVLAVSWLNEFIDS